MYLIPRDYIGYDAHVTARELHLKEQWRRKQAARIQRDRFGPSNWY